MKKLDFNANSITIMLSAILLAFGIIYGALFYNRKPVKINYSDDVITKEERNDDNVKYSIKEVNYNGTFNKLLSNKYIESIDEDNNYIYSDLEGRQFFKDTDYLDIGVDNNLYKITYEEDKLEIDIIKDGKQSKIYNIVKHSDFNSKVYYQNDNNYYLIGYLLKEKNKETLYYLSGEKIYEYSLYDMVFLGDYYFDDFGRVITHDSRYIVISSDGHNNSKSSNIFDLVDGKYLSTTKHDNIISLGDGLFIINDGNKSTIMNDSLSNITIPYDFIDKVGDNYLVARDKKIAILDKERGIITDFEIPYYGKDFNYHLCCNLNNNYNTYIYNNNLLIEPYEDYSDNTTLYFLNKENKLSKINDSNFSIGDFIYTYDKNSNSFNIYNDEYKKSFSINLDTYFKNINYYNINLSKLNDTIVMTYNDTVNLFDYNTGEVKQKIEDKTIEYTNNIKIKVHYDEDENGSFVIYLNDKEYDGYNILSNNIFKKINKKYYIFADNKYAVISKEE